MRQRYSWHPLVGNCQRVSFLKQLRFHEINHMKLSDVLLTVFSDCNSTRTHWGTEWILQKFQQYTRSSYTRWSLFYFQILDLQEILQIYLQRVSQLVLRGGARVQTFLDGSWRNWKALLKWVCIILQNSFKFDRIDGAVFTVFFEWSLEYVSHFKPERNMPS